MSKKCFIVAGANGSGKTTFANLFTRQYNLNFVNSDEIAKEIDDNKKLTAGKVFFRRVDNLIETEKNFAIESTLSGLCLKRLIKRIKTEGYNVQIIYIFVENPQICINRIKERCLKGGHYVTDSDVIRRYFRGKNNFWNIYRLLVDKWFLIYNSKLNFDGFCVGKGEEYSINDCSLFFKFMLNIEVGSGSR